MAPSKIPKRKRKQIKACLLCFKQLKARYIERELMNRAEPQPEPAGRSNNNQLWNQHYWFVYQIKYQSPGNLMEDKKREKYYTVSVFLCLDYKRMMLSISAQISKNNLPLSSPL